MGGGDLNQKKSWHPHTIKNQEKVWKAEQAKLEEEKRLKELQKEISEERNREELRRIGESSGVLAKTDSDKKLEWMYKSSTELVNREEYLLGRTIDKTFETLQAEEQKRDANNIVGIKQSINHVEHDCVPFSIREYRNLSSNEQVDLQRKQMEDPLMLIKQREMESRRKLLENPVKLKELHRILKTDQQLSKTKNGKKSKKSKKSKKKHKKRSKSSNDSESYSDSNSDSDKDLDAQLAKKYNKIKGSLLKDDSDLKDMSLTKLLDAKYETISKELDKAAEVKLKRKESSEESEIEERNSRRRYENRNRDRNDSRRSRSPVRQRGSYRENHRRRSRGRDKPEPAKHFYNRSNRRDRSRSNERTKLQEYRKHDRNDLKYSRHRSRSDSLEKTAKTNHPKNLPKSNKFTEEEKEARRREMMENAAWRETDRTQAVKRHREAYEREEHQNKAQEFDKDFINKEVKKAISNHSSVESRIRSNLNNIQRTTSSMNSNFARK